MGFELFFRKLLEPFSCFPFESNGDKCVHIFRIFEALTQFLPGLLAVSGDLTQIAEKLNFPVSEITRKTGRFEGNWNM